MTRSEQSLPIQVHHPDPAGLLPYRPTNTLAVASLVLGIFWIFGIGSALALIFGYVARAQIRKSGERGDGMAIAGVVLGWVGVTTMIVIIVLGSLFVITPMEELT